MRQYFDETMHSGVSSSPQHDEHTLDEHKLHVFLSALQSLVPPLFAVVLQNAPFTSRAKLHGDVPAIEGLTSRHTHTHTTKTPCEFT